MTEIEFNNGFVVALALFYGHSMRHFNTSNITDDLRINGAADHLFGIEYPREINYKAPELKEKIEFFVKDAIEARNKFNLSKEEADKLFERCKEILKEIDEKIFNLEVIIKYD